jgi:hypothetical protein
LEYDDAITQGTKLLVIAEVAKDVVRRRTLLTGDFRLCSKPGKRGIDWKPGIRRRVFWTVDASALECPCLCIPSYGEEDENWDLITFISPYIDWKSHFVAKWHGLSDGTGGDLGIATTVGGALRCSLS